MSSSEYGVIKTFPFYLKDMKIILDGKLDLFKFSFIFLSKFLNSLCAHRFPLTKTFFFLYKSSPCNL